MKRFKTLRSRLASARSNPPAAGVLETSVAVLLSPGPAGFEVLFIRRAVREDDPWSGHIGLPGGRRDPADTGLFETSIRETREEIGVSLTPESFLGALDDLAPSSPSPIPLMIRPFVFGLPERPPTQTSAEVAASYWVPLDSLHAARGCATVSLREKSLKVPCFLVPGLPEGLVVWGLTYRILNGLLPLI